MKLNIGISIFVVAASCGTLPALAQKTTTYDITRDRDDNTLPNGQYHLGKLEKAGKIIGMEIKDSQDQKLGRVKDLAIDLQNGRIVEVIVGTGGMLGVDEQYVAVPPSQFSCDAAAKTLRLNVDKTQFKSSPSFKMSSWEMNVRQDSVAEVYQFYSTKPYFASDNQTDRNKLATPNHLGDVWRASKVIGTTVRNPQDEKVGKVENLMVDLPAGRVVEVILASGGFLGLGDELSAIPPQSFHAGGQSDMLVLDTTKETLSQSPHFKSSEWADANNPDHVAGVYHAYNVEPYFSTNAVDNTAQNVRDRADSALTPLSQGNSPADIDTTRQIRKQIIAADGFSINARNVKIITINGRVTLRGPVASEDEKQKIGDIATKATSGNVDNQLQVKGGINTGDTSTTDSVK